MFTCRAPEMLLMLVKDHRGVVLERQMMFLLSLILERRKWTSIVRWLCTTSHHALSMIGRLLVNGPSLILMLSVAIFFNELFVLLLACRIHPVLVLNVILLDSFILQFDIYVVFFSICLILAVVLGIFHYVVTFGMYI